MMRAVPREVPVGRRIAVFGPSGSGKSTLSRQLGETLGLPVLELDSVFHAYPNWVDLDREAVRGKVSAYLAEHSDGWVLDGNYSHLGLGANYFIDGHNAKVSLEYRNATPVNGEGSNQVVLQAMIFL